MTAIALIGAVQRVELVSSESWLSGHLNSILLALAAISAAALAAYVAIRNQERQLAHDRYLRNQDHIRDTLDAVVEGVNRAVSLSTIFHATAQAIEKQRDRQVDEGRDDERQAREKRVAWNSELSEKGEMARAALRQLPPERTRLEMRLGPSHPLVISHGATRDAIMALIEETAPGINGNRDEERRERDDERFETMRVAFAEFRAACYAWFNQ